MLLNERQPFIFIDCGDERSSIECLECPLSMGGCSLCGFCRATCFPISRARDAPTRNTPAGQKNPLKDSEWASQRLRCPPRELHNGMLTGEKVRHTGTLATEFQVDVQKEWDERLMKPPAAVGTRYFLIPVEAAEVDVHSTQNAFVHFNRNG